MLRNREVPKITQVQFANFHPFGEYLLTRTDKSNSDKNFSGTVDTDTQNRTSRNGAVSTSAHGEAEISVSASANTSNSYPAFEITTGTSGGSIDLTSTGTLFADHNKIRQQGTADAKNSGDEDFTRRTGSSNFTPTFWSTSVTVFETGNDNSSDSSGDYSSDEDLNDDNSGGGEAQADGAEADENNGTSSAKANGSNSVTIDTIRITFNSSGIEKKYNRHEKSTETTQLGDESSSVALVGTWTEDLWSISTDQYSNPVTKTDHEKGAQTRTFTTAGSNPGDQQELEITRDKTRTEKTRTDYLTGSTIGIISVTTYVTSIPIDWKVVEQKTVEDSDYSATHQLGSDGQSAVGGKLDATHTSSVTTTTTAKGGHEKVTVTKFGEYRQLRAFTYHTIVVKLTAATNDFPLAPRSAVARNSAGTLPPRANR